MNKDATNTLEKQEKTSMKEMPLAFIDFEMSGLNPEVHEITEMGLVLARQPDFAILDEWEAKVMPKNIETANPESLEIGGFDKEVWEKEAISIEEALTILMEKAKGAIMVGQNVSADVLFLQKELYRTGIENRMDYHRMDSMSVGYAFFHDDPNIERFSLRGLAERLGIENKNAHTALSDARTTYEVVKKILGK